MSEEVRLKRLLDRLPAWVRIVIGIAAAVLGAVIAIRPSTSLGVLALLIGTGLIATGVLALLDRDDHRSVLRIALTGLWIAAGVFVLVWPGLTSPG